MAVATNLETRIVDSQRRIHSGLEDERIALMKISYQSELGQRKPAIAAMTPRQFEILHSRFKEFLPQPNYLGHYDRKTRRRIRGFFTSVFLQDVDASGRISVPEVMMKRTGIMRGVTVYLTAMGGYTLITTEKVAAKATTTIDKLLQ